MMSQAQLLAYVRGGEDGTSYTQEQLLAQDYATSPFSAGILSADYRFAFYDTPLAKSFRWFVKLDTEDGERYEEQTEAINGKPLSDVRCLVWQSNFSLAQAEYGQQLESQMQFSVLPEEVEMNAGDLALLTQPGTAKSAFNRFIRGEQGQANFDPLPHWPCSEIVGVWVDKVKLPASTYQATPTGIQWLAGAPAVGVRFSIRWKYLLLYKWAENEDGVIQIGSDGLPLPQIGAIEQVRDFNPALILS